MKYAAIGPIAIYLPERVETNEQLQAEFPTWADPKTLIRVEGATHFFDGRLAALAKTLVEVLEVPAKEAASSGT